MTNKVYIITRVTVLFMMLLGAATELYSQCNAVIGTNISPVSGCEVLTVQFSDNSAGVVSRSWDFGDGSPLSNAQNPAHSFNAGQGDTTYTVTLTIECTAGQVSSAQEIVTVYSKPAIDFIQGKSSVCAITDSVCLTNLSANDPGNNYLWNFGDGTISNEYEPCKVYSTPGTYDLDLTVTNEHGCVNSRIKEDFIEVIPVPNTAFTVSDATGCDPFIVHFTNITDTTGNSYSGWTWNYDDGSPEVQAYQSAAHTFQYPGKYDVTLGTSNSLGCSNFSTQTITVNRSPVAAFTVASPVCWNESSPLEFIGSASDTALFDWVFTDGLPATGSDVGPFTVSWESPGIKKVDLKITDQNCTDAASKDVVVNPLSIVSLSIVASEDTICSGQEVTFKASPDNFLNYQFFVNSTMVQSSHHNTYTGSGFGADDKIYVNIADHNGCTELVSDTITLTVLPTPAITLASTVPSDTICSGEEVIFTASPAGFDEYSFYIGNTIIQSGPADTFLTTGLTDGSMVYGRATQTGCQSVNSNAIRNTVLEPLPAPSVNCGTTTDSTIEFVWDDLVKAAGFEVSVNGGVFQVPSTGTDGLGHLIAGLNTGDSISVEVRAFDGSACGNGLVSEQRTCVAQICDPISFDLLEQDLTACEGEELVLGIHNISPAGYSVQWNNGQAGTDTLYAFTADQSTVIGVTLIDSTQLQCPSVSKEIRVETAGHPEVSIQALQGNEVCTGTGMTFTASPSGYDNFKFFNNSLIVQDGPGNTYTSAEPDDGHFYFVVASNGGCIEASDSVVATVQEPLIQPMVHVASSGPSSVIFAWKLVQGATGYMVSINHGSFIIPSAGQAGLSHIVNGLSPGEAVTASVIALGDGVCGNSDVSLPATGFAETCSGITYSLKTGHDVCQGDSVIVTIRDINLDNYTISWGGGAPGKVTTRVIRAVRDTTIVVVVNNPDRPECPGTMDLVRIRVHEIPEKLMLEIPAGSDTVCEGEPVRFTALPAGYDAYEFYDGFRLLQAGITNTFETDQWIDGHSLTVLAKNNSCAGETSDPVVTIVKGSLKSPQVNCGSSTDSTISFSWDPVPGAEGYLVSSDGGAYELPSSGETGLSHHLTGLNQGDSRSLFVVATGPDPCGFSIPSDTSVCYAMSCNEISFIHAPYDTICEGESLLLTVSGLSTPNYALSWNGGPLGQDTALLYQGISDSKVTVKLTDLDQPGCPPEQKHFDIKVLELPLVTISSTSGNDTICEGELLRFMASPAGWDSYSFYTGNSTLLQDSGYHIYETDTLTTDIEVYVETVHLGCRALSDTLTTSVLDLPPVNLTASSAGDICYGEEVIFTASAGYERYHFKDNNRILANTEQPAVSLSVRSEFVIVQAYKRNGCSVQSSDTIWFNLMPLPQARLEGSADTICLGEQVGITVIPGDFSFYEYYMNDSIIESGSENLFTTGFYRSTDTISAVITDHNGCRNLAEDRVSVYIWPFPENSISSTAEGICLGDSLKLEAGLDPSVPTTSFSWNTGSRDTSLLVSPSQTTGYYLFSVSNGCTRQSDSIMVEVDTVTPVAYAGEDATICIFDSLQLEAMGGMAYQWSPDSLVNDPFRSDPSARAHVTTEFIVTVTNTYCSDRDTMILYIDRCLDDLTTPVPQIITPNGDGSNDYWIISDIDYFTENSVEIYNRWGSMVYSAGPYNNSWDGRATDGNVLPVGTYYYVINLGNGVDPRVGYIIIHR